MKVLISCSACVNEVEAIEQTVSKESQPHEHAKAGNYKSMPDNVETAQLESLPFWRNVLHAPYHILECIESGYHLPLKFFPPPHTQRKSSLGGVPPELCG